MRGSGCCVLGDHRAAAGPPPQGTARTGPTPVRRSDHGSQHLGQVARTRPTGHPGGVNSPVRAFRAVGGHPVFFTSGQGPYATDVDGNTYVDLVGQWGPALLATRTPQLSKQRSGPPRAGLGFGAPHPNEVELAELIVERVDPVDQVRLVNSGTEATMSAIRVARGFTGRDVIIKFAGCYHGHPTDCWPPLAAESGHARPARQRRRDQGTDR